jgi:hypothetical protein
VKRRPQNRDLHDKKKSRGKKEVSVAELWKRFGAEEGRYLRGSEAEAMITIAARVNGSA